MMFSQNRADLRAAYADCWQKHQQQQPLTPLEQLIVKAIQWHPEYQPLLSGDRERLKQRDYLPEMGETNPFLHMGLHLALWEQEATDRPAGIKALLWSLRLQQPDPHQAEHRVLEVLAEVLWQAQRQNRNPDEQAYLALLRERLGQY